MNLYDVIALGLALGSIVGVFGIIAKVSLGMVGLLVGNKSGSFYVDEESSKLKKELEDAYHQIAYLEFCLELAEDNARPTRDPLNAKTPINEPEEDFSDEIYGDTPESLINPELLEKNRSHDEKIERLKAELEAYQVGVIYDVPHEEIDKRYQPKPVHEYTE